MKLSVVFVLAFTHLAWNALAVPDCPPSIDDKQVWLADPSNCSVYYVCHNFQRFQFECPAQTVWSGQHVTCVPKGSFWDLCSDRQNSDDDNNVKNPEDPDSADTLYTVERDTTTTLYPKDHPCAVPGATIIPKKDNCAQYYNCSSGTSWMPNDPYLFECSYPLLFNPQTNSCEKSCRVECGDRKEPLWACEYVYNQCQRSHCIPCDVRFPSCLSLPDGLNPWMSRLNSPYYVVCVDERVVYQGRCESRQLFDPQLRTCVVQP